ncbi:hypothetical protein KFL_001160025 [Klebsormidium nitens]|uniref:Uncharacterized protein n=1 Tax=Klebsormidium nitens TaxID=105231 RepID=A0A1Y1HZF5_KLENI|nr:hypothetical protein KFL_001160025 [Klebsormidium nitens]|eukprot:GAQ82569.1 hypothetical protein KFL_001160025 [Klebsormidium nitens]
MARLLVEKLEFDAPEIREISNPGSRERRASNAETRVPNRRVYVAAGQVAVAQQILQEACNEVGETSKECTFESTRLKLYRLPADWIDLNGDALSGFSESSAAPGLVLRTSPIGQAKAFLRFAPQVQTAHSVDIRLLRRRGCCLLPYERAELRRLAGRERKERDASLVRITLPSQAALAAFSDLITLFNHEDRTVEKAALLPSGVRIPCAERYCECPLTAFCEETVRTVAAACSIQAAWRAVRGRARLPVSLHRQVLERRAAVCVQRYWRAFLLRARCALLRQLREVAAQAAHETLAMSLAEHARMLRWMFVVFF